MWRFKPFGHKEPTGLEGRYVDVGTLKLHVRNAIAEGGFSCVYLAEDTIHSSKQYALKHIICGDEELLELVKKEISVMKTLRGHPNIVTLHAQAIFDMGRTKEAFLVMEICDKSLVNVLESRGAGYFEEKQVLLIFRDICNAVFAMHCQSIPIAHRDLKAENLLLGSDGLWKLCDFGSTSTNHKRFEKPEEMGIEEDIIRKHTTPAYRAPEMWDLFRRELINEKVDIWALGCLLFRICYFKSAFDGESKLQVLNGNYRIPELPKYSSFVTDLIRDMLEASPHDRPDITQVWFRVNQQLPVNLQKSLPDSPPDMQSTAIHEGASKPANKSTQMPRRSPPPPPSSIETTGNVSQPSLTSGGGAGQLGAFWSTQHAEGSLTAQDKNKPKFDDVPARPENHSQPKNTTHGRKENIQTIATQRNGPVKSHKNEYGPSKDFELTFFQKDTESEIKNPNASNSAFKDEAFNSFVADFDTNKLSPGTKSRREETLEAEIERLKGQLKETDSEKSEITFKFEKLSAICRSQRQEIQELKQALAARTPSPNKDASRTQISLAANPVKTSSVSNPSPEPKTWQAFADDSSPSSKPKGSSPQSVRTRNSPPSKHVGNETNSPGSWGFGTETFTAAPTGSGQRSKLNGEGNSAQRFGNSNIRGNQPASQPAGWAGF